MSDTVKIRLLKKILKLLKREGSKGEPGESVICDYFCEHLSEAVREIFKEEE